MSHPTRIDARDLTYRSFFIPGVNDSQAIDGQTVQSFDLEPGAYSIFIGSGLLIVVFAVSDSGILDYGTSYDTTVSGRGTDTLKIIGFEITVDASALDSPGFIFATIGNIGEEKEFVTHANVRLAATRYLVQQQSGRIADFEFTVNPDGLIEYDPQFDSSHEGFLAGRGTNKLTIIGYWVRIDARTLSYPRFLVPGMTKSFLPGNVIHKLQLIPDTYSFQFPGGGYAHFVFRVTQAGEIDFDPAYDGFLAGRGTRTLEMRGYQTSIDARRFPRGIYLFGLDAWVTSTDLRLLPDSYAFMEGAGGICDIRFRLDVSGRLSYDAALDVRAGGCLAGQGTHQLAFLGFPLGLDTASLGTGVHIGGMHVAFNKAQPFQTVYLFPKQDIELTTLTNPPIKAKLSVSEKGAITINVPPPLAILQLRGISVLQLGRTNDTETTHQETSTGDNIMAEQSEPLIKLEPGGTAPILSYNVPEPTSYSGRNFIDLQFNRAWFKEDLSFAYRSPLALPGGGPSRAATTRESSDLSTQQTEASAQTYRSMYGKAIPLSQAPILRMMKRDGQQDPGDFPTGPSEPITAEFGITSPLPNQAISGPSTGVALEVTGFAVQAMGKGSITGVQVKIGDQPAKSANLDNSGQWRTSATITTAGSFLITAIVAHSTGKEWKTSVKAALQLVVPPPGATDSSPPVLTVSSPINGAVLVANETTMNVVVSGTASDPGSGVSAVSVIVDGNQSAIPASSTNDWADWAATIPALGTGSHTLLIRCVDKASNVTTQQLTMSIKAPKQPRLIATRLLLVESYKLSSFTGSYGAGRTIKTFSLLPGEKTKISIKTYAKTATDAKQASSILDSFTQESANDFEDSVSREQGTKENYDESFKWSVRGEASASWGLASAKIEGGANGGSNAAREEFAKNISNALQKHSARASAKRDVQVNTSFEVKSETGEETEIERVIENVNVSRTLNFVFRQINQEHVALLHLTDVRVGFLAIYEVEENGGRTEKSVYKEVTMPQLDALLQEVLVDSSMVSQVRAAILHQLDSIFDYLDVKHSFVEERPLDAADPNSAYLRVKKGYNSTYNDPTTGMRIDVPGIILAVDKHVMRTDGVIVEALLGQGEALDGYSSGLQEEAIREKWLMNELTQQNIAQNRKALEIVTAKDKEAAEIYKMTHSHCPEKIKESQPTTQK